MNSGAMALDGSRIVSSRVLRSYFLPMLAQLGPQRAAEALHGVALLALRGRALVEDDAAAIRVAGQRQDRVGRDRLAQLLRSLGFGNELFVQHANVRVGMRHGLGDDQLASSSAGN